MSRRRWHIRRERDALWLTRPGRAARFDLSADTLLPGDLRAGVLAHEIRKDIWRRLRDLRGFTPVVRVAGQGEAHLAVRAGGTVAGSVPIPQQARATLAALLASPAHRTRWIAHARARTRKGAP